MIRIAHISDLHFGRDDATLIDPLQDALNKAEPDVIAVSGDLTQRARAGQFRAARAFLDRLPAPWICVPGNHDIPLYNLPMRLLRPYAGYRRTICRELSPSFQREKLLVQGLNTAWPFSWQRGHLRKRHLTRACKRFKGFDGARIVMAHHPFRQAQGTKKQLMPGAEEALHNLAACGTDVILTGHLHAWRAEPFVARTGGSILQVHVGTGLSTRLRGQDNDFAILDIAGRYCTLTRMVASVKGEFAKDIETRFTLNSR